VEVLLSTAPSPDLRQFAQAENRLFSFIGAGTSSRRPVEVVVFKARPGSGISFLVAAPEQDGNNSEKIAVAAHVDSVVNTLRNVVLGKGRARVCFVEHILAAAALWGADDLVIEVNGPEIPLGDGSASFWLKLFEDSGLERKIPKAAFAINEACVEAKGDRQVIALPSQNFSIAYMIDWQHPAIGKRWCTWTGQDPVEEIADARTFSSQSEQQMLGQNDDFVSLTKDGFSKPLRYEDEPVRHKLLDLLGDLTLFGVNPLAIKGQFISIKGGHELDVQLVRSLLKQGLTELRVKGLEVS
jgi:UDP-3-O-[3-hydroxymyristoyl] N-acetylglucosamine deacetylase